MAFLFGGAEQLSFLLAQGLVQDTMKSFDQLEEGIVYRNFRKIPLCYINNRDPLGKILLIGKDALQGPRNGR